MTGLFSEDATEYDWRGINSRGQATGGRGRIGRTVPLWVERKFKLGWRALEVRRVGDSTLIAAIKPHPDGPEGRRTWWAEA